MFAEFLAAHRQRLLGLFLLLVGAWGSHLLMVDNQLDRLEFTILLVTTLCIPVLLRWSNGFFVFFALMPWIALIRRLYLQVALPIGADPLVLSTDVIFGVMAVGYLLFERKKFPKHAPREEGPLRLIIYFFLSFCVLQIFNPYMNSITSGVNGFRQFPMYIVLVFLVPVVLARRQDIWRFLTLLTTTAALAGLYGAYQALVGLPAHDAYWVELNHVAHQQIGGVVRAFSTFSFTSTFSHYCVIGLLAGWALLGAPHLGRFRLITPLLMGATLLGLALTFVRSSYLGLLVAGVLTLVLASKPQGRLKRMVGVLVVGSVLLALSPQSNGEGNIRANQEVSTTQLVADRALSLSASTRTHSFNYRLGLWRSILVQSTFHPQGFGLGVGTTSKFGGRDIFQALAYSESQVFSVLAELGWVGFLTFLLLCGMGLRYTYVLHDRSPSEEDRRILRYCFGAQAGLFVVGISGGPVLYTLPGGPLYWSALGVVFALGRIQALEASSKAAESPPAFRALAGASSRT